MRKRIVWIFAVLALAAVGLSGCGREAKYADALRVGTMELPKTLMPYVSAGKANTFVAGLVYDTLLDSVSAPVDSTLPDGSVFEAPEEENYFLFDDNLCEKEGAYPRKEGSKYGWVQFDPTEEQYQQQLKRKGISQGINEIGEAIEETAEEFAARAEKAVPAHNWMEYRFKVREGYTWSDGEPFTVEDIVFTFKYALKNAGALASVAYFLDNFYDAYVDDGDLVLLLATNKLSDIRTICSSILILPEHIWSNIRKPAQEKNLDPVGTGAYTVPSEDYIDDTSLTLVWRDDYNPALAKEDYGDNPLKKIALMRLQNEDVMLNAMQMGDIDVTMDPLTSAKAASIADNPRYDKINTAAYDSEFVTTLALNVGKNGAFHPAAMENSDLVRKAISLAIDQKQLIDDVLYGQGIPVGDGLVQDYHPHALRDKEGKYIPHQTDVEQAKQLLEQAGYPADSEGMRQLSFSILANPGHETLVNAIGKQLKEALGITIVYEQGKSDYSEVIKQSNGADFDMIINTVTFSMDKLLMFDARFGRYPNGSARVWNVTGVNDSDLTELMWQMDTETDIEQQYQKAAAVQNKISQLYVEIPLYAAKNYSVYTQQNYTGWVTMKQDSVLNGYSLKYVQPAA